MKRGKRRRGPQAHGHEWNRPGDFTKDDPSRTCTACGLAVTIVLGKGGRGGWNLRWFSGATEHVARLPTCDPTAECAEAAWQRFLEAPRQVIQ